MLQNKTMTHGPYSPGGYCRAFTVAPVSGQSIPSDVPRPSTGKSNPSLSLIIAGGGTGGHLFPGIAVAEEVLAAGTNSQVRFVGTGNRFETRVLSAKGFEQNHIRVQSLKGKTRLQQIKALASLPWKHFQGNMDTQTGSSGCRAGCGGVFCRSRGDRRLDPAHSQSPSGAERDSRNDQSNALLFCRQDLRILCRHPDQIGAAENPHDG